jgi:Small, acid-soluble spore proteins, alpha/beta type.
MVKKDEQLKLEIAKELGLYEKIREHGWKSLSPKETGRIGGLLSRRKKSVQTG